MAKRKEPFDPVKQAAEFRRRAQELVDDGTLDPIEGERALDALVRKERKAGAADDDPRP